VHAGATDKHYKEEIQTWLLFITMYVAFQICAESETISSVLPKWLHTDNYRYKEKSIQIFVELLRYCTTVKISLSKRKL